MAAAPKRDDRYSWCLQETAIVSVSRIDLLYPQNAAACVSLSKSTMSKTRRGCPCLPFSARCRRGAAYLVAPIFRVNRLLSKHSGFFGSRRSGMIRDGGGASLDDVARPSQPAPLFGTDFLEPGESKAFRPIQEAASILRSLKPSQSELFRIAPIFLCRRAEDFRSGEERRF